MNDYVIIYLCISFLVRPDNASETPGLSGWRLLPGGCWSHSRLEDVQWHKCFKVNPGNRVYCWPLVVSIAHTKCTFVIFPLFHLNLTVLCVLLTTLFNRWVGGGPGGADLGSGAGQWSVWAGAGGEVEGDEGRSEDDKRKVHVRRGL